MTETASKLWGGTTTSADVEAERLLLLHLGPISRDNFFIYEIVASEITSAGLGTIGVEITEPLSRVSGPTASELPLDIPIEIRGDDRNTLPILQGVVNLLVGMKSKFPGATHAETEAALRFDAKRRIGLLKDAQERATAHGF